MPEIVNVRYNDGISSQTGEPPEYGFEIRYNEELGAVMSLEVVEERLTEVLTLAICRLKEVRKGGHLEKIEQIV